MLTKQPLWLKDYGPGWVGFTFNDDAGISRGISFFQSLEEKTDFGQRIGKPGAEPSHVFFVINERETIEANVGGIQVHNLSEYINDPSCRLIFRRPLVMEDTVYEAFTYIKSLEGNPYEYVGLVGKALSIVLPFERLFPAIRRLPVPLHVPGARYCSATYADGFKHTLECGDWPIYQKWHVTRISPSILWNEFKWADDDLGG